MHDILARRHSKTLAAFASSNVLIGFDYDGTLAPIVTDPAVAEMRPATRRLLASVAARYPTVVISGRARQDLMRRLGGVPVFHLSGNHGLEPWAEDARYERQVRSWLPRLSRALRPYAGIVVEDKGYSVTIHYRHARPRRTALAQIAKVVRSLPGARSLGGLDAISLVPDGAPTKGAALERIRRLLACDTAIYVGDDQTDEDAFASASPDRLLAIRVGGRGRSRAAYRVKSQTDIDHLLSALATLRPLRRGR